MKNYGPCIYFDTSSKGDGKRHNTYRADVTIAGVIYRRRDKDRDVLEKWLRGLTK